MWSGLALKRKGNGKGKSVTRYLRGLPPGFQWRQTFLFALASHSINLFHQLFFLISSLEFLTGDILLFIKNRSIQV